MGLPVLVVNVKDEEGGVRLPGNDAEGAEIDLREGVRIARVPAGKTLPVVEAIVDVPPEDDVTEPHARFGGGVELVRRYVLPPEDAVNVNGAEIDLLDVLLFEDAL